MGKVVNIAEARRDGMSESQHKDLEMYRRLGVGQALKIEGHSDEECELKWLNAITDSDSDTVYYTEPGLENAKL